MPKAKLSTAQRSMLSVLAREIGTTYSGERVRKTLDGLVGMGLAWRAGDWIESDLYVISQDGFAKAKELGLI